jgi:hypothetical protein
LDYHIALPDAPTAVWANDSYIYMSTLASGVYRSTISGAASSYLTEPDIVSNDTVYLHGNDDYLCVTSVLGVDRYNLATSSGIHTFDTGIHKCYQTTSGTLYYLENNLFFGLDESSSGIDGDLRRWQYYTYMSFLPTTVSATQVRVNIQYDFPYDRVAEEGNDIRFLDSSGRNLTYYISDWYPYGAITVDIDRPDIDYFYMLYGNNNATTQTTFLHPLWNKETYTGNDNVLWDLIHPKLHTVYTPNTDWVTPDYTYEEFYGDPLLLNDIHVTEETSSYNDDNTIFMATDRGAYVIEERQGDEENSDVKRYYVS